MKTQQVESNMRFTYCVRSLVVIAGLSLSTALITGCGDKPAAGAPAAAGMPAIPVGVAASRMTAARVTLGSICLSSSSHLLPMLNS